MPSACHDHLEGGRATSPPASARLAGCDDATSAWRGGGADPPLAPRSLARSGDVGRRRRRRFRARRAAGKCGGSPGRARAGPVGACGWRRRWWRRRCCSRRCADGSPRGATSSSLRRSRSWPSTTPAWTTSWPSPGSSWSCGGGIRATFCPTRTCAGCSSTPAAGWAPCASCTPPSRSTCCSSAPPSTPADTPVAIGWTFMTPSSQAPFGNGERERLNARFITQETPLSTFPERAPPCSGAPARGWLNMAEASSPPPWPSPWLTRSSALRTSSPSSTPSRLMPRPCSWRLTHTSAAPVSESRPPPTPHSQPMRSSPPSPPSHLVCWRTWCSSRACPSWPHAVGCIARVSGSRGGSTPFSVAHPRTPGCPAVKRYP